MNTQQRQPSLPFMDIDSLPDDILGVDDMFVGNYLKGVEADALMSGMFPSVNLEQDAYLGQPGPIRASQDIFGSQFLPSTAPQPPSVRSVHHSGSAHSSGSRQGGADETGHARGSMDDAGHARGSPDEEDDDDDGDKPGRRSARASAAARKVTPQRKQNNRKAQQRYREKRKAQAAELELKVALLTTELDNMKAVQGQATQLQEENAKLRAALGKHQENISALKKEEAEVEDAAVTEQDGAQQEAGASYDVVVSQLRTLKERMQRLLEDAGVSVDEVKSVELPAGVAPELETLLVAANKASFQQIMLAPMCPKEKVLNHRAAVGAAHPCEHFRCRWNRILLNCKLSDNQQEALLQARTGMLEKLRGIYEERQHLNQITMSIMLPRPMHNCDDKGGAGGAAAGGAFQGPTAIKMQCVERWGGGCMLSQSAELVAALDQLKANLTLERKLILQMHEFLLRQLLQPIQAAVMFIQAETDPVEPLHIGNLVAIHKGLVSVPPPLQLDPQQEELLMRPYRAIAHSGSHGSSVTAAAAEVSC